MKKKTKENVYTAFIGEAKAYFRLLAYAEKAEEEKVPQIALLFRAIAEAERVTLTSLLILPMLGHPKITLYVLKGKNGNRYVGITNDLMRHGFGD